MGVLVAEGSETKAAPRVRVQLVAALRDGSISRKYAGNLKPLCQRIEPPNDDLRRGWGSARGFRVVGVRP